METQNSRRILDRSRDPGLKKRRIAEDPSLSLDRTSNGRTTIMPQRPAISGLPSSRRLNGDLERSDPVRGLQPQLQNQHLEILDEYKAALGDLTFNSKPVITNLTIIAGENLEAAKAIAAIVSSHILEVPSDQKLPSLYLLDSIVKNIGKDYIKYFGFKLPEVFCKAYRQVDPSIHNAMRHLFGTWKGVFPPQPLQAIEKELGFAAAVNKLPSGATARLDTPASRPGHSIHVNPKYLEAQQRLQHSSKGSQHTQREGNVASRIKGIAAPFGENGYDSDLSKQIDEQYSGNVRGTVSVQRNGYDGKNGIQNPISKKRPPNHDLSVHSTIPMNESWKNSDEEEYTWDDLNPRVGEHDHAAAATARDHWSHDDCEKRSETSGDSLSTDTDMKDQAVSGVRGSNLWSEEPPLPERIRSFAGRTVPGLSETNKVSGDGLSSAYTVNGRTSFQSEVAPASIGSSVYGSVKSLASRPTVTVAPQNEEAFLEVASPSAQSLLYTRDSPSAIVHSVPFLNTTLHDERESKIHPESRSSQFSRSHYIDPRTKFRQESSGNIHLLNQRVQSRNIHSSLSAKSSQSKQSTSVAQQPEYVPLSPDLSHQVQKPFSRALASTSSLPKDPNPLPLTSSGQLSSNSLLAAVNGILNSHTVASGPQNRPLESSRLSSRSFDKNLLPTDNSVTTNPSSSKLIDSANVTNNNTPVSSLLSSLVAKGLISASSTKTTPDTSYKPAPPHNHSPELTRSGSSQAPIPLASLPISAPSSAKSAPPSTELSSVQPADEKRGHIGFEFKGNVLRVLHPAVISSLFDDFPYTCGVCDTRVKNQDQVSRHLEWHALRNRESKKASRVWYADSISMLAANAGNMSVDEPFGLGEGPDCTEPMVPADETQCLCILCGEMFEDYYDKGMDQWMFKGAVYANVPCFDATTRNEGEVVGEDSIVHDKCISQQV